MQNYKQGNVTKSSGGGTNSTGSKIQAIQSATKHHALASSLCNYEKFDVPTELEIEIWRSWKEFKILLKNVTSQNERVNILQREVSQSHEKNDKIIKAIVYGILHQQSQKGVIGSTGTGLIQSAAGTQASYKYIKNPELSSITMDHYEYVINILLSLIRESYDYLKQNAVNQILWLCDNLISKAVPRLFEVFLELIRCVTPITTDKKSVNLNVQLVDIFNRNINWTRFSSLIFFKFLRQIEEHIDFDELRAQEIALCLRIWEVKKDECYDIGREFMRVFVNILRIPQMKIIFEDIIQIINEKPLFYHLQGMQKQLQDEYLRYLIPLSVEEKLNHMLINIPLEAYQWYLKWFVDSLKVQYGSDSETIMVDIEQFVCQDIFQFIQLDYDYFNFKYFDIVRHIVVNVKQDQNIVRQYNILPKYVLIAGIINSQKHEILMSATMSAVFIDWLHFSEQNCYMHFVKNQNIIKKQSIKIKMQQTQNIPGYTGFKPSEEPFMSAAFKKQPGAQVVGGNKIPGYAGYVPGVKSENVFGESYGKTSGLSGNGQIQRGFDQPSEEKYKSMAKASYLNQRELYQTMQQQKNQPQAKPASVDDIPRHVQAKFFGVQDHEQDRYAQSEKFQEAAMAFYGDGSRLKEVYGKKQETLDDAAAKFYGSDTVVKIQDPNKIKKLKNILTSPKFMVQYEYIFN